MTRVVVHGRPLAYFLLHALAMRLETGPFAVFLAANAGLARLWTATWLAVPLPLLLHPAFVRGVVWPILGS